ncbi:hypothetical protein GA0115245_118733 [Streptomyces sp. di188]|nr:hypothetical protein GA0115238_123333 [Streptomyces sp. di50b]SCE02441.1 hypothetical protein GA0115245_118733 [Streptomyces sp. di188]
MVRSRRRAAPVLAWAAARASADAASRITVPVRFLVQWDDERVPREQSLALYDALASEQKSLHANPGGHGELPPSELDDTLSFFTRYLSG